MNDEDYKAQLERISYLIDTVSDGFRPPSSFNQLKLQLTDPTFRERAQFLDAMIKRVANKYGRTLDQIEHDLVTFDMSHTSR